MGEWQETTISYLAPCKIVCELCGQLVPGRHWAEEVAGRSRIFCNHEHAEKYETYWLPLYGEAALR
jgi:hypothetical protein